MSPRWLILLLVLAPSVAAARSPRRLPPAPALTADASATTLTLTFTNPGPRPLSLPIRVLAGEPQYDWLTLAVRGPEAHHTVRFVRPRRRAVIETVVIAPGAHHVETIDLRPWLPALDGGTYDLVVTWTGPTLHATAATTVWVAPRFRCGLSAAAARAAAHPAPAIRARPRLPAGGLAALAGLLATLAIALARVGNRGAVGTAVPDSRS